jgi:hypothetical protein
VKTTVTSSGMQRNLNELPALEFLTTLANVRDEEAHAVSFYFDWSSFSDTSHREEALNVRHLVKQARGDFQPEMDDHGLSMDLERILKMEDEIRETPAQLRAVFACGNKHIWQEFDLPVRESVSRLAIAKHFQLVPLSRALESCTPHCVAIVEHDKARAFIIRGIEVHEMAERLPSVDLSMDTDDSRVGWSHHIEGNVNERAKAYMKKLAIDLHQRAKDAHCRYLVVGCREDLWSELEPQFAKAGLAAMIAGHFHLPSFDLAPPGVLKAAKSVLAEKRRQLYANFWESIQKKPAQSAVGVESVLKSLESGRVHTLFLGNLCGANVSECADCNKWSLRASDTCVACGSSNVSAIPAEELLFRKALFTDAEILAPDTVTAHLFGDVGAILRY